jgi:hypothetical protein
MRHEPRSFNAEIGCEGKVSHPDFNEAAKAAKRTNRQRLARVGPYRCTLCHRWHVGTHEWELEHDKRARSKRDLNPFPDSENPRC